MKSVIQKSPETMTAKERVKRTFAFEKTDRVTIGYVPMPPYTTACVNILALQMTAF